MNLTKFSFECVCVCMQYVRQVLVFEQSQFSSSERVVSIFVTSYQASVNTGHHEASTMWEGHHATRRTKRLHCKPHTLMTYTHPVMMHNKK